MVIGISFGYGAFVRVAIFGIKVIYVIVIYLPVVVFDYRYISIGRLWGIIPHKPHISL